MKIETCLFAGVTLFFFVTAIGYTWWSDAEPAGSTALTVSFLMSALVFLFLYVQQRKHGSRPEDHKDAEIQQRSGPVDFFPPRSICPVMTAVGYAVAALGVVYGVWLLLIGLGLLAGGVFGFLFEYGDREP